ncbi:MAG: ATP synthase F1, alpha subunit [Candidatus Xenolissoclinum pacificiensis L6]|uniref:ATP synthase subunit alpha n=1 Tax=Candidatus Xenolissoclinum pacificiensis L6 TaxID=1401685 RepID=W2UZZ9_9RICK|nr:MAG: ATP synthase F1, alpha subunit [Candidatus Xenolissoclinum pacificiensis L6]
MNINVNQLSETISKKLNNERSKILEVGTVLTVADGVATVCGLEDVMFSEVVKFSSGALGQVQSIYYDSCSILILEDEIAVTEGDVVSRTHEILKVPVGKHLLGRVVDALGKPLDGDILDVDEKREIEVKAPGVMQRQSVHEPLQTGIKIIDALIPIGRGQRQLIIGDRQTGKTTVALDTILNQASINKSVPENERVYCIYVAIGQKESTIARLKQTLLEHDALQYTIIVSACAGDVAVKQFLAAYTGCTMGEYFRDNGMHGLIVYDDLSKHAIAYREISLLLRRPPGREAFPGDIFYIHSRLLERAAKMSRDRGSGSLTALPIVETQEKDISAYIPTNVISITDGQIFLDSSLFYQNIKPAISIGTSVSRVGSAAQRKAMKQVVGSLKLELAEFRELEAFMQFSSDLDQDTKNAIRKGQLLTTLLTQGASQPVDFVEQVMMFFATQNGFLDHVEVDEVKAIAKKMTIFLEAKHSDLLDRINTLGKIEEADSNQLKEILSGFFNIKQSNEEQKGL